MLALSTFLKKSSFREGEDSAHRLKPQTVLYRQSSICLDNTPHKKGCLVSFLHGGMILDTLFMQEAKINLRFRFSTLSETRF